jgi:flagellar biosynthesis GTPase FlhF
VRNLEFKGNARRDVNPALTFIPTLHLSQLATQSFPTIFNSRLRNVFYYGSVLNYSALNCKIQTNDSNAMFSGRRLRKKRIEREEREAQQRELLKRKDEERQRQEQERQRQERERQCQEEERQSEKEEYQRRKLERRKLERRRQEEERQRQIEIARHAQLRLTFGVSISVRRVGNLGSLSNGGLHELTDAILLQMRQVQQSFFEGFPTLTITHIEYIMNDKLYKRFEKTRNHFQRLGRNYNEQLLFHGTRASNVSRDNPLI